MEATEPTKTQWRFLPVARIVQWKRRSSPLNVLGFTSTRHQQKQDWKCFYCRGKSLPIHNI